MGLFSELTLAPELQVLRMSEAEKEKDGEAGEVRSHNESSFPHEILLSSSLGLFESYQSFMKRKPTNLFHHPVRADFHWRDKNEGGRKLKSG